MRVNETVSKTSRKCKKVINKGSYLPHLQTRNGYRSRFFFSVSRGRWTNTYTMYILKTTQITARIVHPVEKPAPPTDDVAIALIIRRLERYG
jgi:hypothetical protein